MSQTKPHPQVEALLQGILKPVEPAPPLSVALIRTPNPALNDALVGPGEPVFRVWDTQGPVPLRWYQPTHAESPLLVYVHGGGFVGGTLDSYDTTMRALALRTDHTVVSVSYSLSPEAEFPRALEEVTAVLRQLKPPAVAGDSAGGQLVAAALHGMLENGEPTPAAAVLVYPMLDASMSHDSYGRHATGYNLAPSRLEWFWRQYHGQDADLAAPSISPIHSPHLDRFPRTLVITAEFDPLHDEAEEFTRRTPNAEHMEATGMIHGFFRFRKAITDPEVGPDATMTRIGRFLRS